jgi:hypothetical protein
MRLTRDEAIRLVEERFGQQVAPGMELLSSESHLRAAVITALRERLMLAERALERADRYIYVANGMSPLPEVWLVIRMNLSHSETAEWERLNKVVVDLVNRIETHSMEGRP